MKIVIAPDSFKESLPAREVALSLKRGFQAVYPDAEYVLVPLGDGGEGTLDALVDNLGMERQLASVANAFGEASDAPYASNGQTAVFEMAGICGLETVPRDQRDPLHLTTQGVGEMILHLAREGHREILIGVGGSATNDGGIGMAAALGYRFLDKEGRELEPVGASLAAIQKVDASQCSPLLEEVSIQILTDVTNPLCGPKGATMVFSKQKGLPVEKQSEVDQAMRALYQLQAPDLIDRSGAGAGGGMAAGLVAFAGGEIQAGIDYVLDRVGFDELVKDADLVIVGEGRMDQQSLAGKTPIGVARRTPDQIPVIAICGSLGADLPPFPVGQIQAAFPIIAEVSDLSTILSLAGDNLVRTARNIGNLLKIKM